MRTDGLCKNFPRVGTIAARSIVGLATTGAVLVASDATAPLVGISTEVDSTLGDGADVFLVGSISEAVAAAAVDAGDLITAAAGGEGTPLNLTTGGYYVGMAAQPAAAGDIFPIIISPGYVAAA